MAELKLFFCFFFLVAALLLAFFSTTGEAASFSIADYGGKPDGRTDSTKPLLSAWNAACCSAAPAMVHVPSGSFLVKQVAFSGPCKRSRITLQIDGALVAPDDQDGAGEWIVFDRVHGVSILGGTIDGRGSSLWAYKASGHRSCPSGASSLVLRNSKAVVISGLTSVNSELYHIVIDDCEGVTVQGVKITAPGNSPNTDGIHVQMSSHVTITGAGIKTGDDCISVGQGTANQWVEQVSCGPGHGISIGSLGKGYAEAGVQNVTVRTAVFTGTENGLRIKTWGRPSEGFVRGVLFEHAVMHNVQNPIIIDQNYCPDHTGCPHQSSGVKISGVTYSDIHGSSASQVAVNFDGSPANPCTGIGLQDIELTYGSAGVAAESSCSHADGSASGLVVPPACL